MTEIVRAVARENLLGEGPVWDALARQPWAGSLLALRPGVAGLALPPFAG